MGTLSMQNPQSVPQAPAGHPLWRAAQIRTLEPQLARQQGLDLYGLMCRAGQALFDHLIRHWPAANTLWIFCGAGNNGGDGYVLARLLHLAGYRVTVCGLGEPAAALPAHQAWLQWRPLGPVLSLAELPAAAPDLVVDALLGIGPSQPLRGAVLEHIAAINGLRVPVLAVDVPSGLAADTGQPLGAVVRASHTLSFIGYKRGLLTGEAAEWVGRLALDPLGMPELTDFAAPDGGLLDYCLLSEYLRRRPRHLHKGDCGRVLLCGGGPGMPGALRLASESALRAGAGLVRACSVTANLPLLAAGRPELMLSDDDPDWRWPSVTVFGPGLGQSEWAEGRFADWLAAEVPSVVDADGLNWLARTPARRDNWILTPHPGEAARLLGCSTAEVSGDRFAAVRALQARYGGVVLLKGPGTLVCDGERLWVCRGGNPGMASGGMGDLLAGLIAGLWAQGLPMSLATLLGVCVHGAAGDLAARSGERGMLASDLLPYIRQLVNPRETDDDNEDHRTPGL
ncbi:NAD(P)H-hydrate dehydratase [Pseudaeromonas sp. ZJS20]|uniref:NAD(P)H-hydrate dehydratase n=1 Tax=Pseudaeromonas aegiceratis TaxID=3153928 RepID=UPI00390CA93C